MTIFSNRLPEHLQDIGLWCSLLLLLGTSLWLCVPLLKKYSVVGYILISVLCTTIYEGISISDRLAHKLAATKGDLTQSQILASGLSREDSREIESLGKELFACQHSLNPSDRKCRVFTAKNTDMTSGKDKPMFKSGESDCGTYVITGGTLRSGGSIVDTTTTSSPSKKDKK